MKKWLIGLVFLLIPWFLIAPLPLYAKAQESELPASELVVQLEGESIDEKELDNPSDTGPLDSSIALHGEAETGDLDGQTTDEQIQDTDASTDTKEIPPDEAPVEDEPSTENELPGEDSEALEDDSEALEDDSEPEAEQPPTIESGDLSTEESLHDEETDASDEEKVNSGDESEGDESEGDESEGDVLSDIEIEIIQTAEDETEALEASIDTSDFTIKITQPSIGFTQDQGIFTANADAVALVTVVSNASYPVMVHLTANLTDEQIQAYSDLGFTINADSPPLCLSPDEEVSFPLNFLRVEGMEISANHIKKYSTGDDPLGFNITLLFSAT